MVSSLEESSMQVLEKFWTPVFFRRERPQLASLGQPQAFLSSSENSRIESWKNFLARPFLVLKLHDPQ